MMNEAELGKLATYIEENLRASQNAGMGFIDPKHYKRKMHAKQNHVAYGRRGSGKSSLLSCLRNSNNHFNAYINIEDYKDISFPNILLHVLRSLFEQLVSESKRLYPWYKLDISAIKSRRDMSKKIKSLKVLIKSPDRQEMEVRDKHAQEGQVNSKAKIYKLGFRGQIKKGMEKEEKKKIITDKLEDLQLSLTDFKELLLRVSKSHDNKNIILSLDDLYFLKKEIQPRFVDFFHRISKGTNLHIKIATIKHRTILYSQTDGAYIGMESGHDIHDIDMDYSLDKFEELKGFMMSLLDHANNETASFVDIPQLFSGDAFSQLCLASGGVPRDFLSLFLKLLDAKLRIGERIGKVDVTDMAINNINTKLSAIGRDSGSESDILENYLHSIKNAVYRDKRTNAFLVAKEEMESRKQARQAIRELADMRLLHLIDNNTSCAPSDGRRYEAYILDVGLYDNSRPRNFFQLEPGSADDKSRRDRMRASPRLDLEKLESEADNGQLTLTTDDVQQIDPAVL